MPAPGFFTAGLVVRLLGKALWGSRGSIARLTPKRCVVLAAIIPVYVCAELIVWISFLLDDIFFRGYRHVAVTSPVFIVGPPRSGTTLLQRLLARDSATFTSMRLWELMFAPSITLKKCCRALGALDRRFGGGLKRSIIRRERRIVRDFSRMHVLSVFKPEEDELILLHRASSTFLLFAFPFYDVLHPLLYFDQTLPRRQRLRIMGFYRRCLQCHLYVFGPDKRYLGKSPSFCTKIDTLRELFPGAGLVLTVRNPLETVPSTISLFAKLFSLFNSVDALDDVCDEAHGLAAGWYVAAVEMLAGNKSGDCALIGYQNLISNPARAIRDMYASLDIYMGRAYKEVLSRESRRIAGYQSRHVYNLEIMGLEADDVYRRCRPVFEAFSFVAQTKKA